jgi:cell wall-associated NlpC family hydrolase
MPLSRDLFQLCLKMSCRKFGNRIYHVLRFGTRSNCDCDAPISYTYRAEFDVILPRFNFQLVFNLQIAALCRKALTLPQSTIAMVVV